MKSLRAVVVDDEKLARRGLALRLANIAQVEAIAECANGQEALRVIGTESPDLVFLDIQMPGMDGFDLVCELQADTMPLIIFVTAFDQYAIDAFRIHAVDYLLKPINYEELTAAIDKFKSLKSQLMKPDIDTLLQYIGQREPEYKSRFMITVGTKIKSIATSTT